MGDPVLPEGQDSGKALVVTCSLLEETSWWVGGEKLALLLKEHWVVSRPCPPTAISLDSC